MVKEKYLPFVEPEKEPEPPKTPQQIRKEKIKNFWDYHKWHVMLVVGLVVAVVWTVVDQINRVEPDYTVPYVAQIAIPSTVREELETCLEAYAEDRNGDGKVVVEVLTYQLNSPLLNEEPEKVQAELLMFFGDAENNINAFYIGDETNLMEFAGYEELIGYLDGREIGQGENFTLDEIAVPLKDTKLIPENSEYRISFNNIYFAVRADAGSLIEENREDYDASLELYQRILKDEKINFSAAEKTE